MSRMSQLKFCINDLEVIFPVKNVNIHVCLLFIKFSIVVAGIGLLKEINNASTILIVSIVSACLVLLIIAVVIAILLCRKHQKPTDKCKSPPTFFIGSDVLEVVREDS